MSEPLTPERLAELRRIAEAATAVEQLSVKDRQLPENVWKAVEFARQCTPATVVALLDALDAARVETERLRVELELAREVLEAFRSMVYRYQWAHQFQGVDVVSYRARDAERVKKALCRYDDSRRGGKS